ncbi:MAG: choice-of-anchor B family protein, partial [Rhodothermales bacterium]|nr:choice-of-anchor B family protein [Rhodothermales bacterium]
MRNEAQFSLMTILLLVVASIGSGTTANAQTARSGDGVPAMVSGFGGAVAVGDHDVFVAESRNATEPGVVYVFQKGVSGWASSAKIVAEDGEIGDGFGTALAASGNTLLVSSSGEDNKGAVYVFTREANGGWIQTAKFSAEDGEPRDNFGGSLAISGNLALIGAPRKSTRTGAAYAIWRNSETGTWSGLTRLAEDGVSEGDAFGSSLAIDGMNVYIGASRFDAGAGAVFSFTFDTASGEWVSKGKLPVGDAGDSGFFGSSIAVHGHHVLVGAPRASEGNGMVITLMPGESGWEAHESIIPEEGTEKSMFGSSVAVAGSSIVVGAPGSNGNLGAAFTYEMDHAAHGWKKVSDIVVDGLEGRAYFGSRIVASDDVIVVGVPGSDHGAGSGAIFTRHGDEWLKEATLVGQSSNYARVVGEQVNCEEGSASAFSCNQIDLVSFLPVAEIGGARGVRLNDVWGWTDPETSREYAIVGRIDGTSFVDITDANNPVYVGTLPRTEGSPASTWRDMKTYKNHVFIVADNAGEHGIQILDLSELREAKDYPVTFTETAHYDGIHSAHNIVINEASGFAYSVGSSSGGESCGGGLHMINIQDPTNPTFAGCFADPTT